MNLKTPLYMVSSGLIIVFLVAATISTCDVFGIDLTSGDSCDEGSKPSVLSSVFFNIGLTGIFMVLIGVIWTIKTYFIG
ncbi:hypothetical protein [Methanolobus sp. WCC5]|uniref:hypothetical protein n=1 Tax=Methanolobus sp. WCC5 TaxID=3125785 RepID=UPI00324CD0C8